MKKRLDTKTASQYIRKRRPTLASYRNEFGAGKEAAEIFEKVTTRMANAKWIGAFPSDYPIMEWLWRGKLCQLARYMPVTGHSMGYTAYASIRGTKMRTSYQAHDTYAKSCKWAPTYGSISMDFSPSEIRKSEIIGGIITIIGKAVRGHRGIHAARWVMRTGAKSNARAVWANGYITAGGWHGCTLPECDRQLAYEAARKKAKKESDANEKKLLHCKLPVTFRDSILAHNCDPGTRAFAERHNLDLRKSYAFGKLYKLSLDFERPYLRRIFESLTKASIAVVA